MSLFPGQYIHIGGDEVVTNYWAKCAKCQGRMQAAGLKNYHELQGAMTREMSEFLAAHHRRLVGWDEILEGGLPPGATVMSWSPARPATAPSCSPLPSTVTPSNTMS